MLHANIKYADQPVHPCSLVSLFFIRLLDYTIDKVVTGKISISNLSSLGHKPRIGVCFAIIVLQMYCYYKCSLALPQCVVDWFSVCDCGIS